MGKRFFVSMAAISGILILISSGRASIVEFDQEVTNSVIYGSGNNNGGFTTFRDSIPDVINLELGLRAHTRFPLPSDTPVSGGPGGILSHGNGVYGSFEAQGYTPPVVPGDPGTTPGPLGSWNFDWSINTNWTDPSKPIDTLTYRLQIDYDPGPGTDFLEFDPIHPGAPFPPFFDSSFGNNGTGDGGGVEATTLTEYNEFTSNSAADDYFLVQNSWNLGFFSIIAPQSYDPDASGLYDINLLAFVPGGAQVGEVNIQVQVGALAAVVPEAASFIVWGLLGVTFGCGRFWRCCRD